MKSYQNLRVGTGKFFYGQGSIEKFIPEILRLGGKPFIIGGPSSIERIRTLTAEPMSEDGIPAIFRVHDGACTRNAATAYSAEALACGCTVIVGVGGGKCIDLSKCASTFSGLPLITVPTSLATCVASSSVCIMYHEDGTPDGSVAMEKEVDVVIADSEILAGAPNRLLAAGIFDSIAKLPEVIHHCDIRSYRDCPIEKYICTVNSQAIYDFLTGEAENVYFNGLSSGRFTDFALTILLHTSVVSGFSCGVNQLAIAHGLYDFMRRSFTKEAAPYLHGEIVAVGVLIQMAFNGVPEQKREDLRRLMNLFCMPATLKEIGFPQTDESVRMLMDYLIPATGLNVLTDSDRLRQAIEAAMSKAQA